MRKITAVLVIALCAVALFAEGTPDQQSGFKFTGGITLGTDVLDNNGTSESWTKLGFTPDLGFGKVGVGLDLSTHFQLYPSSGESVKFYAGDWVPADKTFSGWLNLYLPKIMYVRYGQKGDPVFAKVGSMDDFTLGNGFVMGDYSNMNYLPATRIIGLDAGLDGSLFNFPLVGAELVAGNIASLDLLGGRVYVRPFLGAEAPILKGMEAGLTFVTDTNPYFHDSTQTGTAEAVSGWGVDLKTILVNSKVFPVMGFADLAFNPNGAFGSTIGVGGRLISFITYGAQLRVMQDTFIPDYFDTYYDLYRSTKYSYEQTATPGAISAGYLASLGFSLLEGKVAFQAKLDGPFAASGGSSQGDWPHFKAVFILAPGTIGTFWASASYEKYYLGQTKSFFPDLVDPTDAAAALSVNYQTGASVLTLAYKAHWDPTITDWVVQSSITATMKF